MQAVRDGKTRILPARGEADFFRWLENIQPWCISRQLWWGHQIPVWYGPKTEGQQTGLTSKFDSSVWPLRRDEIQIFCGASEADAHG